MVIDELVAKHTNSGTEREYNIGQDLSVILIQSVCTYPCVYMAAASYGFVLLKMKKALPSGIGVIFSFFTRSEMTGRGPDGTSGSSSSAAVSSMSSSSSLK